MSLSAETPMVHVALDKIPCPSLVMQDSGKSYFVLLHSKGKPENAYNMNFVFWPKLIICLFGEAHREFSNKQFKRIHQLKTANFLPYNSHRNVKNLDVNHPLVRVQRQCLGEKS